MDKLQGFTFTSSRVVYGKNEQDARINLANELSDNEPEWDITDVWNVEYPDEYYNAIGEA